jgi:hypothetical protein
MNRIGGRNEGNGRGAMISMRRLGPRVAVAAAVIALPLFLGACEDEPLSGHRAEEAELPELPPGIHPVISVPDAQEWQAGQPSRVALHLIAVEVDEGVNSAQGDLFYDHEELDLQEVKFPQGLMGAWNEVEEGHVRFAGISLDVIGDRPVLEMSISSARPLQARDFEVRLDEIVTAEGFENLTNLVSERDVPVLVRGRVGPEVH